MKMFGNIIDWSTERYLYLALNKDYTKTNNALMQKYTGYMVIGDPASAVRFEYTCPITEYEPDE